MAQHALLSPSAAEKWFGCPGAIAMEAGEPDSSSSFADEGTCAHFLGSECLGSECLGVGGIVLPAECIGDTILVGYDEDSGFDGAVWAPLETPSVFAVRNAYVIDLEMAGHVNTYVQAVRKYAHGGALFVEQRLPITTWTKEPDAFGTSDAVVITPDGELQVHDLKYGMGELVDPTENKQLMIYALAAYERFSEIEEIKSIRLVIHQPRVHHAAQEWPCTVEQLQAFGEEVKAAAKLALTAYEFRHNWLGKDDSYLTPSDDACRWCRAKHKCPKLASFVTDTIGATFEDLTAPEAKLDPVGDDATLGQKMAACDLIEKWIKAVRGKVEAELFAGHSVPGYKLVQGKKGNRQWADPTEAEATLKSMRLKVEEMYDLKLISPPSAEKIFGEKGTAPSPKRWNKLQALITQKEGSPSVAPESDKRPALVINAAEQFDDLTGEDMC